MNVICTLPLRRILFHFVKRFSEQAIKSRGRHNFASMKTLFIISLKICENLVSFYIVTFLATSYGEWKALVLLPWSVKNLQSQKREQIDRKFMAHKSPPPPVHDAIDGGLWPWKVMADKSHRLAFQNLTINQSKEMPTTLFKVSRGMRMRQCVLAHVASRKCNQTSSFF